MSRATLNSNAQTSGTELFDFADFFDSNADIAVVSGYTGRKKADSSGVTNVVYTKEADSVKMAASYDNTTRWIGPEVEKDTAWDLTSVHTLLLELGFDPQSSGCDAGAFGFRIMLMYDSGTTTTNFAWSQITWFSAAQVPKQGKMCVRHRTSDFAVANGAKTLAEILANTKRIGIRMYASGYAPSGGTIDCNMRVRRLYANARQRPKLAFSFDDFHPSVVTFVKPIFDSYGWVGAVGACGGPISDPTTYGLTGGTNIATPAQVTTLHDAGWDVTNHTWQHRSLTDRLSLSSYTASGHALGDRIAVLNTKFSVGREVNDSITIAYGIDPTWLGTFTILDKADGGAVWPTDTEGTITIQLPAAPNLTSGFGFLYAEPPAGWEAHLAAQLDANAAYLASQGWTRGSDIVIYPFGSVSPALKPLIEARGYRAARGTGYVYAPYYGGSFVGISNYEIGGYTTFSGWFDKYELPIIFIDDAASDFDTAAELLAMVDRVIADGGVCMPYGHTFTGSGASNYETAEATAFFAGVRQRELQGLIDVVGLSELVDSITYAKPASRPSADRVAA